LSIAPASSTIAAQQATTMEHALRNWLIGDVSITQVVEFRSAVAYDAAAPFISGIVVCTHVHIDHIGWNTMLQDG
jgi:hypothetical protein